MPDAVTVIITPAYNAAGTIERTIRSVIAQRHADWTMVIVDDGSTDHTAEIARAMAAREPRIHVLTQHNRGVSAARNAGLKHAAAPWAVFLDADDTVDAAFLSRMHSRATAGIESVVCGHLRRDTKGAVTVRRPAPAVVDGQLSDIVWHTPAPIHAFLTRRDAVVQAGGFDETLSTNEDWDLWARLVRAGVCFAAEDRPLAEYWASERSLSRRSADMIRDAAVVLDRLTKADPRIPNAVDALACGFPDAAPAEALPLRIMWCAGVELAAGRRADDLVGTAVTPFNPDLSADDLAQSLLDGMAVSRTGGPSSLIDAWPDIAPRLEEFLRTFATSVNEPGLDYAIARQVEWHAVRLSRSLRRRVVGATDAVSAGASVLVAGVTPTAGAERIVVRVPWLRPRSAFMTQAPALGRFSGSTVRHLLGRRLATRIEPVLESRRTLRGARRLAQQSTALARRILRRAARTLAPESALSPSDHAAAGTREAWDAFFQTENPWQYGSAYEQLKYRRTLDLVPSRPIGRALELACAEGHFTVQLASRVGSLHAVDISSVALERTRERCGSAGIGNTTFGVLDFFNEPIGGPWDLIVSSEVLYYMADTAQLERFAEAVAGALAPGGVYLHAHAYEVTDDPTRTGFDWGDTFAARTISDVLSRTPGLKRRRALTTDLYLIELYERAADAKDAAQAVVETVPLGTDLDPVVASGVVWNGAVRTRTDVEESERTYVLPVPMYHRIAEDGPAGLSDWRLSPRDFEHQLRFLRRRGYRSITMDEWTAAADRSASLRGRPILLTFDDAYTDFYDVALPILQRNGFTAHVFVVTGKVGGLADWDAKAGPPAPLMTWEQIRDAHAKGVTFGSHLKTHMAADRLSSAALAAEAAESRQMLEFVLGTAITTIAAPFGLSDERLEHVCEAAGYQRLFRSSGGVSRVTGGRFRTPRIEVLGSEDIAAFAAKIGARDAPEAADTP